MRGHGSQWFSHKMNNLHPLQLKKLKFWEPFGSDQLKTTADLANLSNDGSIIKNIWIYLIFILAVFLIHPI